MQQWLYPALFGAVFTVGMAVGGFFFHFFVSTFADRLSKLETNQRTHDADDDKRFAELRKESTDYRHALRNEFHVHMSSVEMRLVGDVRRIDERLEKLRQ